MDRLTLKTPVTITGLSPSAGWRAKEQRIVMRPLSTSESVSTGSRNGMGWYWQTRDDTLVPIDMSLVHEEGKARADATSEMRLHPYLHYLYFKRGLETLKCVEHILALKTLGLDGVVIKASGDTTWIPYDGRAKSYWQAVEDKLERNGRLTPMAMQVKCDYKWIDPELGERSVALDSTQKREGLEVSAVVNYRHFGGAETVKTQVPIGDPSKMQDVLESRPMMQPAFGSMLPILKILGWRHASNVILQTSELALEEQRRRLHEIALHRVLDLIGAMAVLPEPGAYLAGSLETTLGSHKTDLCLLQKLAPAARALHPHLFEPPRYAPSRPLRNRAVVPHQSSGQDYSS